MHPLMLTRLLRKSDLVPGILRNYGHHHHEWFSTGWRPVGSRSCELRRDLAIGWWWVAEEMPTYSPRSEA